MTGSGLPASIAPMKAVTGELPSDDENWAYEVKWDGMRAIGYCDGGDLRLRSANGIDATARFGDLSGVAASIAAHQVVLDGEIVAFSSDGRPDFGRLQQRMHAANATRAAELAASIAATYVVFDLLWMDGHDLTGVGYLDRRHLLTQLVEPGPSWQVPAHQIGDGAALWQAAADRRLEGIMAKVVDSTYQPGRRSPAWRKIKVRRRQELVVGGWLPGNGARGATFGALLVGYHDDGALRYAGRVGTGFNANELDRLQVELSARARSTPPFDPMPPAPVPRLARWVEPDLVVEVSFGEWTVDGILRHPAYEGQRYDKGASAVVREP
jgi:bifunctional non-homologous end joining protein LigD